MLTTTALLPALLATTATALTSPSFKLVASVTGLTTDPSPQGLELQAQRTAGADTCATAAGLVSPGGGSLFYLNGTYTSLATLIHPSLSPDNGQRTPGGVVVTPGGTATVPAVRPIGIECGPGTTGFGVDATDAERPVVSFDRGTWMACPDAMLGVEPADGTADGRFALAFRANGQRTLQGCADVELVVVCADGERGSEAVEVPCAASAQ